MWLLLHSCSPHSDAAGVHLAPVCSRRLEGNNGNYSLLDTSGETLQCKLGRGGGAVPRGAQLCSGTGWCSRVCEHNASVPGAGWPWKMLLCCHCCMDSEIPTPTAQTWSQYGSRSSPLQLHPSPVCCWQHRSCSGEAEDGDGAAFGALCPPQLRDCERLSHRRAVNRVGCEQPGLVCPSSAIQSLSASSSCWISLKSWKQEGAGVLGISCSSLGCLWGVGSSAPSAPHWSGAAQLLGGLRTSLGPPSAYSVGWTGAAGFPRQPEMDQLAKGFPDPTWNNSVDSVFGAVAICWLLVSSCTWDLREGTCNALRRVLLPARAGAQGLGVEAGALLLFLVRVDNGLSALRAALAQTGVAACIPAACPHTCCLPGPERACLWCLHTVPGLGFSLPAPGAPRKAGEG